jgi:glutaminyl-peptide cyclotransferase
MDLGPTKVFLFGAKLLVALAGRNAHCADKAPATRPIELIPWTKVESFPHDSTAFTQGLVYLKEGVLVETTGQYGKSEIRKVELKTGKVLSSSKLSSNFFGEGVTAFKTKWLQLTWQEGVAIEWSMDKKSNWSESKRYSYSGQGWGLTSDHKVLYMSDGTSTIQIKDPITFKTNKTINVTADGRPFDQLNELEFIEGFLYANRWMSSFIVKIDINSGAVVGIIDLESLIPTSISRSQTDAVLNGIAWNPTKKLMYVTGKYWPTLYSIKLDSKKKSPSKEVK